MTTSVDLQDCFLPAIELIFDSYKNNPCNSYYRDATYYVLREVLSDSVDFSSENQLEIVENLRYKLNTLLPLVTSRYWQAPTGEMSFFCLSKYRANSFKFFFDMISRWLVPGKRLNVILIYAVDFRMPDIGDETYTLCEVKIQVEDSQDLVHILRNLPIIETELRLGIESSRCARRILEIKGLSSDDKTAMIQEDIAYLISRLPKEFDHDILTEMQHVLVMCRDEFKADRASRHLSRIIALHYRFRKSLREAVKQSPHKRHLSLKLFRARLNSPIGQRRVLSVVVGVNFFRDKEIFDKTHLLKAIQNYISSAQAVESSFFSNRHGSEQVCTLYLEIEKGNCHEFTAAEIRTLRQKLSAELKDRIEQPLHPVFMPCNEEEIIRNILSLSSQIKYLRDIPQLFISFNEQSHTHLSFIIILVRVLKPGVLPIQDMFKNSNTYLSYLQDRCQNAGTLRKKYKKEATVFRVKLSKDQFLRADHSIDLNKARQAVAEELSRIIGEFRDYNGGIISKQNELLCRFRNLVSGTVRDKDLLLENFFYSLAPVIMRTVLEPEVLYTLFHMLLDLLEQGLPGGKGHVAKISTELQFVYAMIKADDRSVKEELNKCVGKLQLLHSSELVSSQVSVYDTIYIGYIYRSDESDKQLHFTQALSHALENWESKRHAGSLA